MKKWFHATTGSILNEANQNEIAPPTRLTTMQKAALLKYFTMAPASSPVARAGTAPPIWDMMAANTIRPGGLSDNNTAGMVTARDPIGGPSATKQMPPVTIDTRRFLGEVIEGDKIQTIAGCLTLRLKATFHAMRRRVMRPVP